MYSNAFWRFSISMSPVAKVQGLIAGYPCKSLSGQNPEPKSFRDKTSTTGGGFDATSNYVSKSPELEWALLENVQQMFHTRKKFGNEKPMDIQNDRMSKLGFVARFSLLLNSSDFGLAQSRARAWVLYVRERSVKSFEFAFRFASIFPVLIWCCIKCHLDSRSIPFQFKDSSVLLIFAKFQAEAVHRCACIGTGPQDSAPPAAPSDFPES